MRNDECKRITGKKMNGRGILYKVPVDIEEKYNCKNVIKENKQWLGLKAAEKM